MTNLLRNGSFELGTYPPIEPFRSGAWPNQWERDWWYKPEDAIIGTGVQWSLDEAIVIQYRIQFPEESHLFDKSGQYIFKCFWNGAVGAGWKQTNNLPAGLYRYRVPVKPDHWHRTDSGEMVRPSPETSVDWYLASEVYIKASAGETVLGYTGWLDARRVPIGEYTILEYELVHPGGDLTVSFGYRGRWPFRNNGWFFDGLTLERIDDAEPPPPVPVPDPTPTPSPEIDALKAELVQLRLRVDALTGALSARAENALAVLEAMISHTDVSIANMQALRGVLIAARDEVRKLIA